MVEREERVVCKEDTRSRNRGERKESGECAV